MFGAKDGGSQGLVMPRAGLTAELNGCDKAEQSQAVWAGEPSLRKEGPNHGNEAVKHALMG